MLLLLLVLLESSLTRKASGLCLQRWRILLLLKVLHLALSRKSTKLLRLLRLLLAAWEASHLGL